jgi:methyl-accepting chemotaxis protein
VEPPPDVAIGVTSASAYERGGESLFGYGRSISGTELSVVTEVAQDAVYAATRDFVRRVGLLAAAFVAAATAAAWLLGRRLTKPLGRLRDGAEALGRGDYSVRAAEEGHPELVELARAFNKMASETASHVSALSSSEQRFRSLVTATAQIVWWANADGDVADAIPSWEAYTGQPSEGTKGGRRGGRASVEGGRQGGQAVRDGVPDSRKER